MFILAHMVGGTTLHQEEEEGELRFPEEAGVNKVSIRRTS